MWFLYISLNQKLKFKLKGCPYIFEKKEHKISGRGHTLYQPIIISILYEYI